MIATGALALAPAPVLAQGDTSSIDGYAESLPAAEGETYPAAKPKAKKRPQRSSSSTQRAPSPPSSDSAPSTGAPAPPPTPVPEPTAADRKRAREADEAVRRDPERRKRRAAEDLLDRVARDQDIGAPPATPIRKTAADDGDSDETALASVLSPGSPVLWLLIGMIAIAALAFRARGRFGSRDPGV